MLEKYCINFEFAHIYSRSYEESPKGFVNDQFFFFFLISDKIDINPKFCKRTCKKGKLIKKMNKLHLTLVFVIITMVKKQESNE